eukprot:5404640-Amphidinium_carterae.1
MSHAWTDEGDYKPQAFAVQELQVLPKDVDKHFSKMERKHEQRVKGLVDRETYNEVSAEKVPLSQVQNAPARMVCVVKPAVAEDGTRFVKRKSRLVICGNFLNPCGETSTANLDISVLRSLVSVGLSNHWKFASADIPQAFLYASIEEGRHVYLRPPKICVDFGLVGSNTLWQLKRALYGLRESPNYGKRKETRY